MIKSHRFIILLFVIGLTLLVIAACGGSSEEAAPAATSQPVATMPPAKFTAVAEQSAAEKSNVAPKVETLITPTADASVSRGQTVYNNKKCGDCHGAQGEGIADKATESLVGTTLTAQEFENILRTGDNGVLGTEHIFGSSAISPSGMQNMYAFVKSLQK